MTLWRAIADSLTQDIDRGAYAPGSQLPTDDELSRRFSVNRHTVRRAMVHLSSEGLVRSERGRGTFVVEGALLYRLGAKSRFEENLLENSRVPRRRLLFSTESVPPEAVAEKLGLKDGEKAVFATLIGEADGVPIHIFQPYFPASRFPKAREVFAALGNEAPENIVLSRLLSKMDIPSHRRSEARLSLRLPTDAEASELKMAKTDPVGELRALNVDAKGRPVYLGITVFCGSRVEFILDM